MALTLDPQTQDFGDVNVAPNINVAVKESDNLSIEGTANIIDGAGTTVKTETWNGTGKYTYTPNFSDKWDDMAEGPSSVQLTVKSYEPVPEQPIYGDRNSLYLEQTKFTYDGYTKTPVLHGYDPDKMIMYADTSGIDPRKYYLKVRPREGYYWVNPQGTTDKYAILTFNWEIEKGRGYIVINGATIYNGGSYNIAIETLNTYKTYYISVVGYENARLNTYPDSSIIRALINGSGNLEILAYKNGVTSFDIYTPESTYASMVNVTINVYVTAEQTISTLPSQSNYLYSDGYSYQYPTWNDYDPNQLDYRADSAIFPGYYNAYFTPKSGYRWYDGSTSTKTVQWVVHAPYVPPVPVYSNPGRIDPSSVTVGWSSSQDAYIWIYNLTSSSIRVTLTAETGYGPFATFDLYDNTPYYRETGNIASFDAERVRVIAGPPHLIGHNSSYIDVEYSDAYTGETLGTDRINVYIEN